MKQVLFFFLMAFAILSQAQVGLKVGLNFSNMMVKDEDDHYDEDFKTLAGLHIGPTFDIPIGQKMAVQTGLLWSQRGYKVIDKSDDFKFVASLNYIDIPLMLAYKHTLSEKMQVYAGTGLYAAVGIMGKYKWDYDGDKDEEDVQWGNTNSDDIQRLDLGWETNVGIQYEQVRVNLGYLLGIYNIHAGEHVDGYQIKNRAFQMSISYLLTK